MQNTKQFTEQQEQTEKLPAEARLLDSIAKYLSILSSSRWVFSFRAVVLDAATRAGSDEWEVSMLCEPSAVAKLKQVSQSFHIRRKTDMEIKAFLWGRDAGWPFVVGHKAMMCS